MVQHGAECLVGFITFIPWTIHLKLSVQRHLMKPIFTDLLICPIIHWTSSRQCYVSSRGCLFNVVNPLNCHGVSCMSFCDNSVLITHLAPGLKSIVDIFKIKSFPCSMAFHCRLKSQGFVLWQLSEVLTLESHTCDCHGPVWSRVSCRFYYILALNYASRIKSSETLNEANVSLTYLIALLYTERVVICAMLVQGGDWFT